jgi:uncharacterized protein
MNSAFGLEEKTIEKINSVFSLFPEVEQVIIFGSRVKGNFKEGSDIDLTVKGEVAHNRLNEINIMLDDLSLPYIIETILFNNIDNEDLIEHIKRAGEIFYQRRDPLNDK